MKKLTQQQQKTKLRKKCVTLAKKIVREIAGYKCVKCGRGEPINQTQGSHIYPEGRYVSMSADLDNILCLCAGCHMWSNDSWHESPLQAAAWFNTKYPGMYEILNKRAQKTVKADLLFWEKKYDELNKIVCTKKQDLL
jgi:heterodisulfide reductase subunit B